MFTRTFTHVGKALRLLVALAAAGVVPVGAALIAGARAASAAPPIKVDCSTNSLQTAIDSAAPGAQIHVAGTCAGHFTIDQNLTLVGTGNAVLDGQNSGTTLTVSSGAIVQLTNLTVTDGSSTSYFAGGGIMDNGGNITLKDSAVSGNNGNMINYDFSAGGIFDYQGNITLEDSTVSGNSASTSGGIIDFGGSLTLKDSTVSGNNASQGDCDCVEGGGVLVAESDNSTAILTIKHSTISGNSAGGGGGGIGITYGSNVSVLDSTLKGNTAASGYGGGGIEDDNGSLYLKDSAISGNTAAYGGGIWIGFSFATATLDDSTISGNTARIKGGGIETEFGTNPRVILNHSAVTSNIPDNCSSLSHDPPIGGCIG
jgi:hypothetical protein